MSLTWYISKLQQWTLNIGFWPPWRQVHCRIALLSNNLLDLDFWLQSMQRGSKDLTEMFFYESWSILQGKKQNCNQNARCQAAAMWLKCFNKRSEVATIKLAVLDCDQQSLLSRDPLQRHVDESSGLGRSQSTLYQLRLCRTLFICLFSTAICLILQNYNMLGGQSSLLSNPPLISRPWGPCSRAL